MAQLSVHHTGINLCGLNVGVSEHLGHTLNGNAFGKADFRRKRMSGKMVGDPLVVEKGKVGEAQFLVLIPKADMKSSNTPVEFKVLSNGKEMDKIKSTFVGPNALDRK